VTQQRRCSCSCRLWRCVSAFLPFYLLAVSGVGPSGDRTTSPPLDLLYVRNKLTGSGPVVQLISAVATSSTTVRVVWNVRRQRRYIDGYHVRWRPAAADAEDGFVDVAIEGADVTEFEVGGLRPYTTYEVNVRPWYRSVVGLESKTLQVRTREDGKHRFFVDISCFIYGVAQWLGRRSLAGGFP